MIDLLKPSQMATLPTLLDMIVDKATATAGTAQEALAACAAAPWDFDAKPAARCCALADVADAIIIKTDGAGDGAAAATHETALALWRLSQSLAATHVHAKLADDLQYSALRLVAALSAACPSTIPSRLELLAPLLFAGLERINQAAVAKSALVATDTVFAASGPACQPFVEPLLTAVVAAVASPILEPTVKPSALEVFGAIATSLGPGIGPYIDGIMDLLGRAVVSAPQTTCDNNRWCRCDRCNYTYVLRKAVTNSLCGILQAYMPAPTAPPEEKAALAEASALVKPVCGAMVAVLKGWLEEWGPRVQRRGENPYFWLGTNEEMEQVLRIVGVIGDVATVCGPEETAAFVTQKSAWMEVALTCCAKYETANKVPASARISTYVKKALPA